MILIMTRYRFWHRSPQSGWSLPDMPSPGRVPDGRPLFVFLLICYLRCDHHHEEAEHEEEDDDLEGGDIAPHPLATNHRFLSTVSWVENFVCFAKNPKHICFLLIQRTDERFVTPAKWRLLHDVRCTFSRKTFKSSTTHTFVDNYSRAHTVDFFLSKQELIVQWQI